MKKMTLDMVGKGHGNPYHRPAGSPQGGEFTSALGGDQPHATDAKAHMHDAIVEQRIRGAFYEIAGNPPQDSVRLNDLREKLADIPREKVDAALLSMRQSRTANLMHFDNPREIQGVGSSALKHGLNIYHTLWLNK